MSRNTKSKGTRRTDITSRGRGGLKKRLLRLAKKIGVVALISLFIVWLGVWFILSGTAVRSWDAVKRSVIDGAAEQGMHVENILIEGRIHTDSDLLLALINTKRGDPLLDFNPDEVQPLIEAITWVKRAEVIRRLPDTIYVLLEERVPYALYQEGAQVVIIDREGIVLSDKLQPEFRDLLLISGENAPEHAAELIDLLQAEASFTAHIERARFIGTRRWDLQLQNGMIVRLPEQDVGFAISRLIQAATEDGLLNKDIEIIDLREPDRIIVQGRK